MRIPSQFNWTHIDWKSFGAAVCAMVLLFALFFPFARTSAATGYIDPNGDGTIGGNWGATPSGSYSTTIDEAVRQPTVPTTSDYMSITNNKSDNAFIQMSTLSNVQTVSSVQVWIYHNDGSNGTTYAALYDSAESSSYGSEQTFTSSTSNAWHSVTFSGLSLTQSNLDGLRVRLRVVKTGGGGPSTQFVYAMYAEATYTSSGTLSVDVVDGAGSPVSSPSVGMSSLDASLECQTSTGTLGISSEKIRVNNTTANGNWTLAIAATGGATSSWGDGTSNYDFNDSSGSPAGCGDGADADSLAGQLTVDASGSTITPQGGCGSTGISKGASTAYAQGTTDTVTLLSASGSQTNCYFDLTGVSLSQKVPGETPASASAYTINMTLTATAN